MTPAWTNQRIYYLHTFKLASFFSPTSCQGCSPFLVRTKPIYLPLTTWNRISHNIWISSNWWYPEAWSPILSINYQPGCSMCVECLKIRVFRCVARLSQCLSVPLSVLKKDILIYLCNWIWAGWSCNLNVISLILSLSFAVQTRERERSWRWGAELFAKDEMCPHYLLNKTLT